MQNYFELRMENRPIKLLDLKQYSCSCGNQSDQDLATWLAVNLFLGSVVIDTTCMLN